MELSQIEHLIARIDGCTFASLDATTKPSPGVRKVVVNEQVILFTNKRSSGYENMVKRRLEQAGLDPDTFTVGPLPWGERIPNTPLINCAGNLYLQCIIRKPGDASYFIGTRQLSPEAAEAFIRKDRGSPNQGLPRDKEVVCRCYALATIDAIRLMGEEVVRVPRPILTIKAGA